MNHTVGASAKCEGRLSRHAAAFLRAQVNIAADIFFAIATRTVAASSCPLFSAWRNHFLTSTVGEGVAKLIHGTDVTLIGGLLQPCHSDDMVPGDATTGVIGHVQHVTGFGMALQRRHAEPIQSLAVMLGDTQPVGVSKTHGVLALCIAGIRPPLQLAHVIGRRDIIHLSA